MLVTFLQQNRTLIRRKWKMVVFIVLSFAAMC